MWLFEHGYVSCVHRVQYVRCLYVFVYELFLALETQVGRHLGSSKKAQNQKCAVWYLEGGGLQSASIRESQGPGCIRACFLHNHTTHL